MKRHATTIAMLLLGTVLLACPASAALPCHQEAEAAPTASYGNPYRDQNSSPNVSPNAYHFSGNGGIDHTFGVGQGETVETIVVRARSANTSASSVDLTILVDGVAQATKTIPATAAGKTFALYSWTAPSLPAGDHRVQVRAGSIDGAQVDGLNYDWVELRGANPPAATEANQFHLNCDIYDVARVDPIRPEMDHLHALAGNRSLSDDSTYESLVSNMDTSCEQPFVTSAYWSPATWWNDVRYDPYKIAVYYFAPVNSSPRHIPDGIKMLASEANDNGEITYKCGKDPTTGYSTPVYGCRQDFRIVYHFPECWDGTSLEPESLTDAVGANCPAGTQRIVGLRISFHYPNPTRAALGSPLRVSTGAGMRGDWTMAHADAFEANQQPQFNDTIRQCVMENQPLPVCDRQG